MLKRFLKNDRGLTLVELLAVVVILGIIAAIAVPSIGGIIEKTKKDAVYADATQVLSAAKLYTASNKVADGTVLNYVKTPAAGATDADKELNIYVESSKIDTATVTVQVDSEGKYTYDTIALDNGEYTLTGCTEATISDKTCAAAKKTS